MGYSLIPIISITGFWAVVGFILPWFAPKGPNKGVLQLVLILTAACCWLFWLCCYMAQMNPLIGPKLKNETVILMAKLWK